VSDERTPHEPGPDEAPEDQHQASEDHDQAPEHQSQGPEDQHEVSEDQQEATADETPEGHGSDQDDAAEDADRDGTAATANATATDDAGQPAPAPGRRIGPRRILRGVGLGLSAAALLAATGAVVVAADAAPPSAPAAVFPPAVDVPAGTVDHVCTGPAELTTGEGMSVDPEVDPSDVEPSTLTRTITVPRGDADAPEAEYTPTGGTGEDLTVTGDVRTLAVTDPDAPGVLTAAPVDDLAALAAGATLTRTNAGDLRGLSAAACQQPASTTWLVGGGTDLGQSSRLVLTNSGDTPATVSARMLTSIGAVDAARLSEIVVAPHSSEEVLLEGVSEGNPEIALRVDADGGEVTATVQDLQLDGLVSAGIDRVTGSAPPALHLTIPGVALTESDIDDEVASELRLVNPGEEEATASVRLLGPDGPVEVPGAQDVVLDPGAVLDLTLAGIEPGTYAVDVTSDQPITGGVALARIGEAGPLDPDVPPVDRAWSPAARPSGGGLVQTPSLGDLVDGARVVLSNPGEQDVEVELIPVADGGEVEDPVTVTVPARSTIDRDVTELVGTGPAMRIAAADGEILASTVLTARGEDGQLISVLPMSPDPHEQRSVRVDVG